MVYERPAGVAGLGDVRVDRYRAEERDLHIPGDCLPPPERKIWVTSPHFGQAKPLMFSTTPSTGRCS